MSSVAGIDLSSHAIDVVLLDETTLKADWHQFRLEGKTAWDRTLAIRAAIPGPTFWRDVYLVAAEAPYGRGQAGTLAILNRVLGAIVASLPVDLRAPERCWLVKPHEWKAGLGLKRKPSWDDLCRVAPGYTVNSPGWGTNDADAWQNARDAYCLALWARTENARGITESLTA